ncbi:MAG TPA: PEP-CTERM sorting domain-containing protein [Lacipirellulaceae bacterium]|nr:PEP-CTERM sorting domain-containing protein [Lacipirellulaceae bacterium]
MKSTFAARYAGLLTVMYLTVVGTGDLRAAPLTLNLDSSQSSITLSGSFSNIPAMQQGPGSLTASYSGPISIDVDNLLAPTSIQISGSSAVASISGQWLPEAGGGPAAGNPGTAQNANYGLQVSGGALGNAYAAIRNLEFNVTGGPVPVVAGAFPSTQTLNVASGLFAFNLPPFFMDPPGQDDLSGNMLTNASATPSTYSVSGSTATLTIPISITDIDDDLTIVYTGRLVATGQIPEPSSIALVSLALVGVSGVLSAGRRGRQS